MKVISIKGEPFLYKVVKLDDECYCESYTQFYQGIKIHKYRKYWLFGKIITKEKPIYKFTVDIDITDPTYDKLFVRRLIFDEYNEMKRIEERKQQINNQEII